MSDDNVVVDMAALRAQEPPEEEVEAPQKTPAEPPIRSTIGVLWGTPPLRLIKTQTYDRD
jgi:hypothetical protein